MKQHRETRQKKLVLDAARARHDHPCADDIYLQVRACDAHISRGTVYRNLNQLVDAGELAHVRVPSADRFDCRTDWHYHLFCTGCGAVCDVPLAYQPTHDRLAAEATGYRITRHRMVFEGLCPQCQDGARRAAAGEA